jgi:hypothetical protein
MTSNPLSVGLVPALSGQLASRPAGAAADAPGAALAGIDSEFARVLFELMTPPAGHAAGASASGAATHASRASEAAGASSPLQRALAEARLEWVAAPLVHRAIDAYRELMNVTV